LVLLIALLSSFESLFPETSKNKKNVFADFYLRYLRNVFFVKIINQSNTKIHYIALKCKM